MVSITEFYKQVPYFSLVGGADFDYQLTFTNVRSTVLDGKVTELVRLGPFDFSGWGNFAGQIRSSDGQHAYPISLLVDGSPLDGTLRMRGRGTHTWTLQELGVRSGWLTILGRTPSTQLVSVATFRWTLQPGSTNPRTPSYVNFETLPV